MEHNERERERAGEKKTLPEKFSRISMLTINVLNVASKNMQSNTRKNGFEDQQRGIKYCFYNSDRIGLFFFFFFFFINVDNVRQAQNIPIYFRIFKLKSFCLSSS